MIVGIDIGGANLKFAGLPAIHDRQERSKPSLDHVNAWSLSFPMWTDADRLSDVLRSELIRFKQQTPQGNHQTSAIDAIAITMTGEMADCFLDRREGVSRIATAVRVVCESLNIARCGFYGSPGEFFQIQHVQQHFDSIASANWHAAASWVARHFDVDAGVLVDVGSTTTDLVPLRNRQVATAARTDHDRLCEGSLVYVGCDRTPVCSLISTLSVGDRTCQVINEVFATMADVLVLLDFIDEDANCTATADGQPQTKPACANRISRMVGLDRASASMELAIDLAKQVFQAAVNHIHFGLEKVDVDGPVFLSGHGAGLVPLSADRQIIDLEKLLGTECSRCMPAYAVACLFQDSFDLNLTGET
jgi:probable H4MPT-linked C1 transfer pathway protein